MTSRKTSLISEAKHKKYIPFLAVCILILAVIAAVFSVPGLGRYTSRARQSIDLIIHPDKPVFAEKGSWFRSASFDKTDITDIEVVASPMYVPEKYDEMFFAENTLMLVYVSANSGTYRFGVNSVSCGGSSFCIHVEQLNDPEVGTADMAGWFITAAVPDSMAASCSEFDADLNNF